jgi:hypothetical protein
LKRQTDLEEKINLLPRPQAKSHDLIWDRTIENLVRDGIEVPDAVFEG